MTADLRDQPDGISESDDYRIPSPTAAAKRVHAYVTETGDGLYDEQGGQPLYGRDLAALACAVLHGYRADRPSRCLHVPSDATLATEAAHAATADAYEAGRRDALAPVQVTTAEELDALPVGSVVRTEHTLAERCMDGWRALNFGWPATATLDHFPATVLYRPGATP